MSIILLKKSLFTENVIKKGGDDAKKNKYGKGKRYQQVEVHGKNGKTYYRRQLVGKKDMPNNDRQTNSGDGNGNGNNRNNNTLNQLDNMKGISDRENMIGGYVEFKDGDNVLSGEVISAGKDGYVIKNKGVKYSVPNENVLMEFKKIPAKDFNANSYKSLFTDPRASNDEKGYNFIYSSMGETGRKSAEEAKNRLAEQKNIMDTLGDTETRYSDKKGNYNEERQKLHQQIINSILTNEKIRACQPKEGEKPKFIMLGGRGGSGKSWFTDTKRAANEGREVMFDPDKYLIIDADEIKSYLPEYKKWNAGEVHEESSYLSKEIKRLAKEKNMNIIIDGTMNYNPDKPDKAKNEMLEFKDAGYRTEAHYMFLPVQESAKRAIGRFATKKGDFSGRLVPMDILLGMQDNEKSFDSVKDLVDDWSFRDNRGKSGCKLISSKNN